jgi:hypothetical protein
MIGRPINACDTGMMDYSSNQESFILKLKQMIRTAMNKSSGGNQFQFQNENNHDNIEVVIRN